MRSESGSPARRLGPALLLATSLLASLGAPVRADPPGTALDAIAIYDRARATVAARIIPPFIAYTQDVVFERRGKMQAERSRVILRMSDGKADVTPIAASPRDRIDARPTVKDRPLVYPTTTFGLVQRRSGEQPSIYEGPAASIPAAEPSGPPVIGHVIATARDYDPTLIGTENLDGASVYHLALVPRFDPRHHPIRAMYVDTATFDPRRIAIEVWAAAGPIRSRPTVTVDFTPIDGTWLIARASMDFVLRLGFFAYGGSAQFGTSDVSFPATEPAWLFDPTLLAEHLRAAEPAPAR